MALNNNFIFIGICYRDARKVLLKADNNAYYTDFTLVVRSEVTKSKKNNYITIRAIGELAEKASVLCRNGNKVAVNGEIITTELINRNTAEMKIRITFVAREILLISKPKRYLIGSDKYTKVVELASVAEYEPPKERKK